MMCWWWRGARFSKDVSGWACGETNDVVAKTMQKILFGKPNQLKEDGEYEGIIPKRLIIDHKKISNSEMLEYVVIKRPGGKKHSYLYFKAYSQGRHTFQGATLDFIWFDEEPPVDIYVEGRTRTNNGQKGQFVMSTFTPLLGMSELVTQILENPTKNQIVSKMGIYDVGHYTKEEADDIVASYPQHVRQARAYGDPVLGEGRVYPVSQTVLSERRIVDVPPHWKQLGALDFGYGDHPTAGVHLLYDADNDCIHVRAVHKNSCLPSLFSAGVSCWGDLLYTYPHDGNAKDRGETGETIKQHYMNAGMRLTDENAHYLIYKKDNTTKKSMSVEAGILEILERMKSNRLKIDENLSELFREINLYHRKDGTIVKKNDDLLDALRYGVMMLRHFEYVIKVKTDYNFERPRIF